MEPDSWDDVDGNGAIDGFPVSVFLQRAFRRVSPAMSVDILAMSIGSHLRITETTTCRSELNKVSLTRLEKHVQLLWAQGKQVPLEMRWLAGLCRIQYFIAYPATGVIVIAGSAGDCEIDDEGRSVNVPTQDPGRRLDDLIVVLRNGLFGDGRLECSIVPICERRVATQYFSCESQMPDRVALARGTSRCSICVLISVTNDIEGYGIDPRTCVVQVLVEGNQYMKRIGMGLAEGNDDVRRYIRVDNDRLLRCPANNGRSALMVHTRLQRQRR